MLIGASKQNEGAVGYWRIKIVVKLKMGGKYNPDLFFKLNLEHNPLNLGLVKPGKL
jgi:hypothetical protein